MLADRRLDARLTIAVAALLFAAAFAVRVLTPDINALSLIFTVPVAVLATRFGVRGGAAGAAVATMLLVARATCRTSSWAGPTTRSASPRSPARASASGS